MGWGLRKVTVWGQCERFAVTRAERKNVITIFRYKFAPRGSCFDGPNKIPE